MEKLAQFVKDYRASNPSGWRKLVFGSLAALALLAVVIVYAIQAAFRAKRLAELTHERDVAHEELNRARVNVNLAENEGEIRQYKEAAADALEKYDRATDELKAVQNTHERNKQVINNLRTWEDVDANVR